MTKNIKILILADAEAPHTQRWTNWLVTNGVDVDLITFNSKILEGYVSEPKVISSSTFKNIRLLKMIVIYFKLYWHCFRTNYDVVHAHSCGGYSWCSAFLGRPYVATPWGTDLLLDINKSKLNYLLTKLSLVRASLITTDGKHFINILEGMGIKTSIKYHIFGTDVKKLHSYRMSKLTHKLRPNTETVKFITTRTLYPMHRVDITIKAFSKLVARGLNIEMVVVGGGSEAEYLQHMVNSMDLANVVRFTGMLPEERLFEELAQADLYVSSSPHDAGLAASTAEAMSIGLPVIHTNVGDNAYWASEETGGYVAPVNSIAGLEKAMLHAIKDKGAWRAKSTLNVNKINDEYNVDTQMTQFLEFYNQLSERK